jgi:hypothetical protein
MKSVKTVTWTLKDGRTATAVIEVVREMADNIAYADGWNINLGKEKHESMTIEVKINGKFVDRTYQEPRVVSVENYFGADFVKKVKAMGGYARLTDKVIIKEDIYNEIMAAIEAAVNEADQDQEYAEKIVEEKKINEVKAAEQEARAKELKATEIPTYAISAYDTYKGDAVAAWENEDEQAWATIRKWAPYIEAQMKIK